MQDPFAPAHEFWRESAQAFLGTVFAVLWAAEHRLHQMRHLTLDRGSLVLAIITAGAQIVAAPRPVREVFAVLFLVQTLRALSGPRFSHLRRPTQRSHDASQFSRGILR